MVQLGSRPVRVGLFLLPALVFVALLAAGLRGADGPPGIGDRAPGFTARVLGEGGSASLDDYAGRPVLLNFWASWCVPCVDEAPMLRRAEEVFGDRVAFLGIDVRDTEADAVEFAEQHGLDYLHVRDEQLNIYDDYGLTGQPESFLIDGEGNIVEHVAGPFPSRADLFALLDRVVE